MNKSKKYLKFAILLILGNLIYSFGVVAFVQSKGLLTGGVTGLSLFITYLFPQLPLSLMVLILNIVFFIIGFIVLGKKFALSTLASSILNPFCILIFENLDLSMFNFNEVFASIICAAITIGVGLGLVLKTGASSGGVDIIAIILSKHFKSLSIGMVLNLIDVLILTLQLFTGSVELFVYGVFMAVIYTMMIDKVLFVGRKKIELTIISLKAEELRKALIEELDCGVTLLAGETGYLKEQVTPLLTVIDNRNLQKVKDRLYEIDKDAFLIIKQVNEVRGQGFTTERVYKTKEQ